MEWPISLESGSSGHTESSTGVAAFGPPGVITWGGVGRQAWWAGLGGALLAAINCNASGVETALELMASLQKGIGARATLPVAVLSIESVGVWGGGWCGV